jgi:hypothetical protein
LRLLREPLARFVSALRSYVLHVTTYGDLGGAGSAEQSLADELLAPLAGWPSSGGRKGKAQAGDGGDGSKGNGDEGDDEDEGEGDNGEVGGDGGGEEDVGDVGGHGR